MTYTTINILYRHNITYLGCASAEFFNKILIQKWEQNWTYKNEEYSSTFKMIWEHDFKRKCWNGMFHDNFFSQIASTWNQDWHTYRLLCVEMPGLLKWSVQKCYGTLCPFLCHWIFCTFCTRNESHEETISLHFDGITSYFLS